jgi:hypothetical protein
MLGTDSRVKGESSNFNGSTPHAWPKTLSIFERKPDDIPMDGPGIEE